MEQKIQKWSAVFRALANPYRLEIIRYLKRNGKTAVSVLAKEIGISMKNTSRNLRILKDLNILEALGKSDHVFYSLSSGLEKEISIIIKIFT